MQIILTVMRPTERTRWTRLLERAAAALGIGSSGPRRSRRRWPRTGFWRWIINPTVEQREASDIDLVGCSADAIVMVEGGANKPAKRT